MLLVSFILSNPTTDGKETKQTNFFDNDHIKIEFKFWIKIHFKPPIYVNAF